MTFWPTFENSKKYRQYNLQYWCFKLLNPRRLEIHGHVVQLVTCLATGASLTADPGVGLSILAWSHTFYDWSWKNFYGHSPPFRWIIQEGLLSVQACPGKSVVRWTDRSAMTKAIDLGRKATKKKEIHTCIPYGKSLVHTPKYMTLTYF